MHSHVQRHTDARTADHITNAVLASIHTDGGVKNRVGTGFSGPVSPQRPLSKAEIVSLDEIMERDLKKRGEEFKVAYLEYKHEFNGSVIPPSEKKHEVVEKRMTDIRAEHRPLHWYMTQPEVRTDLTNQQQAEMDNGIEQFLCRYETRYRSAYGQYKWKLKVKTSGPSLPNGETIQSGVKAEMKAIQIAMDKQKRIPVGLERPLNEAEIVLLNGIMEQGLDKWMKEFADAYIEYKCEFNERVVPAMQVIRACVLKRMADIRAEARSANWHESSAMITYEQEGEMDLIVGEYVDEYDKDYKSAYGRYKRNLNVNTSGHSLPDGEKIQSDVKEEMDQHDRLRHARRGFGL